MAQPQSTIQRSFAGGELAPALHARADVVKYVTGLRTCRNFLVQRHGGVANRPGFRFIGACKTNSITVKLLRYVSEKPGESMLLELGNGYIRFYLNGAALNVVLGSVGPYSGVTNYVIGDLVQAAGVVYYALVDNVGVAPPSVGTWYPFVGTLFELPSPFGADLPNWVQSSRVITLTHKDHPPYELINGGSTTTWVLRPVSTATTVPAPTGLAVAPGGGAGTRSIGYVVTAAAADTFEESLPSGQVINLAVGPPTPAAPDVLTWTPVVGAAEYNVYCDPFGNGTYGFIGTATGAASFNAHGQDPDFSVTPPLPTTLFSAVNGYPNVAAYFQQRRFFGYTNDNPDAIYGSRTGFPSNFGVSQPLQSDDALSFKIAGNNHNPVRHLLALKTLVVLTDAGEWTVSGAVALGSSIASPLQPNNLIAQQQTYIGAGAAVPVIIGNAIIYVQARGSILYDLQFDQQVEGLGGRDLSVFAAHLFEGFGISELDYAQNPQSIVWACRSDGILLGLTYLRDQDVWGWHRHDSGAACRFEHVCVVPEASGDTVYVITRRTINGGFVRYIEKLEKRLIGTATFDTDVFFVDAGLSYSGAPVNNVAGLGHLEGQIVAVVGDGAVIFNGDPAAAGAANFTITGGTFPVVFPAAYSNIHVGIPIRFADLETLDLDVQGANIRDKKKRVGSVTLLLEGSARTFSAGPDLTHLTKYALKPYEQPVDQFTGEAEINLTSAFNDNGRVFIRHTDPLPLTILGIVPNVEAGG
jgi:hypothetical protein